MRRGEPLPVGIFISLHTVSDKQNWGSLEAYRAVSAQRLIRREITGNPE